MQLYLPITALAWLIIIICGLAAVGLLAGISRQTWYDPNHAIAFFLLASAVILHGLFVSGTATFGPVHEIDVGADPAFGNTVYPYSNSWKTFHERGRLIESQRELVSEFPRALSETERELYQSCINYCLDHNKNVFPVHVQVSAWDSRIYTMTLRHVSPPVTIGSPATPSIAAFFELLLGAGLLWLAQRVWKEGRRRGIHLRSYDPFALIRQAGS